MRLRKILFINAMLTVAALCSCSEKIVVSDTHSIEEGVPVECSLELSVGDFQLVGGSTRATAADTVASKDEKRINNIWLFQFSETGDSLIAPTYYESGDTSKYAGDSWKVVLKANKSTIYVVANTNNSSWASNSGDFNTLEKLKKQNLTNLQPIQIGTKSGETTTDDLAIPMAGALEVDDVSIFANIVKVPVERMFAKLIINAEMLNDISMTSVDVSNIPTTAQVAPLSDNNDVYQTTAATYQTSVDYITRAYHTSNDDIANKTENNKTTKKHVMYVPENIKGICSKYLADGGTIKGIGEYTPEGEESFPSNPLTVTYSLSMTRATTKGEATLTPKAAVYPGANNTNNFNVNRNYVYKVTALFNDKSYFYPTPSSNCFVVTPGRTLTFWPYFRKETGGGYKFKDYLDPTVADKKITRVNIIWQDKDVIGDNTNGDLVYISDAASNVTSYENIRDNFTIDVKTQKEGNALIGAYNANGDIIWSWHIWVTDNEPDNVGNAIRYTTYRWDSSKIYTDEARIPGYQVMPCNLGALANRPDGSDLRTGYNSVVAKVPLDFSVFKTFGMLYQWGRKDPFPPAKKRKEDGTFAFYYNTNNKGENYNANIYVYDNSMTQISMTTNGTVSGSSKTSELFNAVYTDNTSITQTKDGGIAYAIGHPTTFIATTSNTGTNTAKDYKNNGDWLPGHDDRLWGATDRTGVKSYMLGEYGGAKRHLYDNYGEKSIFDPCPTGWRVPPGDLWLGFTDTGLNSAGSDYALLKNKINCADDINSITQNRGFTMYLEGWKSGQTTFFPRQTSRVGSGQPYWGVYCGNYHNATTDDGDIVNILHLHLSSGNVQCRPFEVQRLYFVKSDACPIRCVRDKK